MAGAARKRTGPATAAGKLAVRLNAVSHGLTSAQVPIPGVEDPAEWAAFRQAIIDDRAPLGAVEEALVERIAELFWRLRRVAPYEAEVVAVSRERVEDDYAKRESTPRAPSRIPEAERHIETLVEARAALASNDDLALLSPDAAHEFVSALVDTDEAIAARPLPGFEDGVGGVDESDWNPAMMRAAMLAMARDQDMRVDSVLATVAADLDRRIMESRDALGRLSREIDRTRRERLLPPERTLINLSKYEAHLGRQLTQALTQLEALQGRRTGQPISLARLHVQAGA